MHLPKSASGINSLIEGSPIKHFAAFHSSLDLYEGTPNALSSLTVDLPVPRFFGLPSYSWITDFASSAVFLTITVLG